MQRFTSSTRELSFSVSLWSVRNRRREALLVGKSTAWYDSALERKRPSVLPWRRYSAFSASDMVSSRFPLSSCAWSVLSFSRMDVRR